MTLNHLLGSLQADWVALYRAGQSRSSGPSDVECLLWPGKNGWTEEHERFFSARVVEVVWAQELILQADDVAEGHIAADKNASPVSTGDYIILPLIGRERVYGALAIIRRSCDRGAFPPVQVQFVNAVGEALALAMDYADLVRQMRDPAITDPRTGMFSNAYLERIVRMETERCNRYGRPFSLILLDWATGELGGPQSQTCLTRKLEQIASVVQKQLRATDVVARHGDEGPIKHISIGDLSGKSGSLAMSAAHSVAHRESR